MTKHKIKDFDSIPMGGPSPFLGYTRLDPVKPDIKKTGSGTRSRVDRNVNASSLEALYHNYGTINQNQYEAACEYRRLHRQLESPLTASYEARDGGNHNNAADSLDSYIDGQTRCIRLSQIMEPHHFKPCEMLVIHDMPMSAIAARMGRGWSEPMRKKRIGECLDSLADALPKTRRAVNQDEF